MSGNEDVKVYQDKKSKAEDFKSSAYTLLIVGIIGLIVIILMITGVLPFSMPISNYIVMGVLFVVFIVIGISSFKSSKQYEKEAVVEEDTTQKIKDWVSQNMTAELIRSEVYFDEDTPEEMKYFKYFNYIKEAVSGEFSGLNASYLDAVCEEMYALIFESGIN